MIRASASSAASAAGALLLAAAALTVRGCKESPRDAAGTVRVQRGRFEVTVSETCTFRPLHSRVLLARASDQIDWIIAEGTVVKPDDLVFTQDRTRSRDWLTRDSNELEAARRNLAEVKRQVQMELDSIELDIRSRQSAVDLARTRLAEVTAAPAEASVAEARASLEAGLTAATDKRAEAQAADVLAEKGFLSGAEAQAVRVAADIADIEKQRREMVLEKLLAGATPQARRIAELQLERAAAELVEAKAEADGRRADLAGRITDAQSNVASLERSVARAEREIASREVRSTGTGVVIYRNLHHGDSKPEVGSRVWSGAGVVDVADTSLMKVRTQLAERHIRHLSVDSVLRVRPDPMPELLLSARVTWIDRWSRDRSADLAKADREKEGLSGVKVFALEAAIEKPDPRIKPGFKGKVEFPLVSIEDAMIVPLTALFGSVREHYVMAVHGSEVRRVPVTLITEDDRRAAISGELTEGQQLLTRGSL